MPLEGKFVKNENGRSHCNKIKKEQYSWEKRNY
jgi:hypothetical protein